MQRSLTARASTAIQIADELARTWLRANTKLLTTLGDLLHSLALLSPSAHAEIRAELAASIVSVLQVYRDYPPPSDHPLPRRPLLALSLLTSVQLLVEMAVTRKSSPRRESSMHLPTVTAIEAAKAALRLSLLWPVARLGRQLTAADQTLPNAPTTPVCTCGLQDLPDAHYVDVDKGPRTDRAILRVRHHRAAGNNRRPERPLSSARIASLSPVPTIIGRPPSAPTSNGDDPLLDALFVVAYERRSNWLVRLFVPEMHCAACSAVVQMTPPPLSETVDGIQRTVSSLTPMQIAAESAFILRPILHLLLIRRFGWRSWKAWLLALLTDLASRVAMPTPTDPVQVVERRRRMAHLLLYLGRSPLFDLILRTVVKRITAPLRVIPVVGGLTSSAIQWMTLLQQYWFYTSAS